MLDEGFRGPTPASSVPPSCPEGRKKKPEIMKKKIKFFFWFPVRDTYNGIEIVADLEIDIAIVSEIVIVIVIDLEIEIGLCDRLFVEPPKLVKNTQKWSKTAKTPKNPKNPKKPEFGPRKPDFRRTPPKIEVFLTRRPQNKQDCAWDDAPPKTAVFDPGDPIFGYFRRFRGF